MSLSVTLSSLGSQTAGCHLSVHLSHIPCVYAPQLLHRSSVTGHFGGVRVLATVSSAAVNLGVHTSLRRNVFRFFSRGSSPEEGLPGHVTVPVFIFGGLSTLSSLAAVPVCTPTRGVRGFLCPHSLPSTVTPCLVGDGHSARRQVESHCGFLYVHVVSYGLSLQWSRTQF